MRRNNLKVKSLHDQAPESSSVAEDFEDLIPTPSHSEDDGNVNVGIKQPCVPSPLKDGLNPEITSEQLFMDESIPTDEVSPQVVGDLPKW